MRRFREFLNESPTETEAVVPISLYLPTAPLLDCPVEVLRVGVAAHLFLTTTDVVEVASLTPTQTTVNNLKVMQYGKDAVHDDLLPLVCLRPDGQGYYIVDGHHRICGAVVHGLSHLRVRVVSHS